MTSISKRNFFNSTLISAQITIQMSFSTKGIEVLIQSSLNIKNIFSFSNNYLAVLKILGGGVWGVKYDEKNKNQQNTLQNGGEHFMRYQKQKVMNIFNRWLSRSMKYSSTGNGTLYIH